MFKLFALILILQLGIDSAQCYRSNRPRDPSPDEVNYGQRRRHLYPDNNANRNYARNSRRMANIESKLDADDVNIENMNLHSALPLKEPLRYSTKTENDVSLEIPPAGSLNLVNEKDPSNIARTRPNNKGTYKNSQSPVRRYQNANYRRNGEDVSLESQSLTQNNNGQNARGVQNNNYLRSLLYLIRQPRLLANYRRNYDDSGFELHPNYYHLFSTSDNRPTIRATGIENTSLLLPLLARFFSENHEDSNTRYMRKRNTPVKRKRTNQRENKNRKNSLRYQPSHGNNLDSNPLRSSDSNLRRNFGKDIASSNDLGPFEALANLLADENLPKDFRRFLVQYHNVNNNDNYEITKQEALNNLSADESLPKDFRKFLVEHYNENYAMTSQEALNNLLADANLPKSFRRFLAPHDNIDNNENYEFNPQQALNNLLADANLPKSFRRFLAPHDNIDNSDNDEFTPQQALNELLADANLPKSFRRFLAPQDNINNSDNYEFTPQQALNNLLADANLPRSFRRFLAPHGNIDNNENYEFNPQQALSNLLADENLPNSFRRFLAPHDNINNNEDNEFISQQALNTLLADENMLKSFRRFLSPHDNIDNNEFISQQALNTLLADENLLKSFRRFLASHDNIDNNENYEITPHEALSNLLADENLSEIFRRFLASHDNIDNNDDYEIISQQALNNLLADENLLNSFRRFLTPHGNIDNNEEFSPHEALSNLLADENLPKSFRKFLKYQENMDENDELAALEALSNLLADENLPENFRRFLTRNENVNVDENYRRSYANIDDSSSYDSLSSEERVARNPSLRSGSDYSPNSPLRSLDDQLSPDDDLPSLRTAVQANRADLNVESPQQSNSDQSDVNRRRSDNNANLRVSSNIQPILDDVSLDTGSRPLNLRSNDQSNMKNSNQLSNLRSNDQSIMKNSNQPSNFRNSDRSDKPSARRDFEDSLHNQSSNDRASAEEDTIENLLVLRSVSLNDLLRSSIPAFIRQTNNQRSNRRKNMRTIRRFELVPTNKKFDNENIGELFNINELLVPYESPISRSEPQHDTIKAENSNNLRNSENVNSESSNVTPNSKITRSDDNDQNIDESTFNPEYGHLDELTLEFMGLREKKDDKTRNKLLSLGGPWAARAAPHNMINNSTTDEQARTRPELNNDRYSQLDLDYPWTGDLNRMVNGSDVRRSDRQLYDNNNLDRNNNNARRSLNSNNDRQDDTDMDDYVGVSGEDTTGDFVNFPLDRRPSHGYHSAPEDEYDPMNVYRRVGPYSAIAGATESNEKVLRSNFEANNDTKKI